MEVGQKRGRGGALAGGGVVRVVSGRLSKEQEDKAMSDMMPWLFDKCNEFEKIHQQEKAALEVKLADGLEREEETQSDMQT